MTGCPGPQQLQKLLDATLPQEDLSALAAHIKVCANCELWLERLSAAPVDQWLSLAAGGRSASPQQTESTQHFRLVRLHKHGGLGEVFEARDEQLQRSVALKVLRSEYRNDAESRRRFLEEAAVTAGLEHPGIVPVHARAGLDESRPWYVMRFVRGETLHEAIRKFHDAHAPSYNSREARLALRTLLGRFIAVCNTVAYAHSQGVLHRDLKPDNVMLGSFGDTLVLDWGLAKRFGAKNLAIDGNANGDGRAPTWSKASAIMSGPGGTPGFMGPEQSAGQGAEVGPASDLYSLGATLYCLLTGRAPFPYPTGRAARLEVVQQVQLGEFPAPRKVNRHIPQALEAICLKALALRPDDRYPSVLALAADVEQWLGDEPVTARPEPRLEQCSRWVRRHRTWSAAVAAAVVVSLLSGAAALAWQIREEAQRRTQVEAALAQARAEKDRADRSYTRASEAIGRLTNCFDATPGGQVETRTALQARLAQEALAFFEATASEDNGDDPRLRLEQARAYFQAGLLQTSFGNSAVGRQHYARALDLYQGLAGAGAIPDCRCECEQTRYALGCLNMGPGGDLQAAERYIDRAKTNLEALAAEAPHLTGIDNGLVMCNYYLGTIYLQTQRLTEAERLLRSAADRWSASARQGHDAQGPARLMAAECLLNLMQVDTTKQRPEKARADFAEAEALLQPLRQDAAWRRRADLQLARVMTNLAFVEQRAGNLQLVVDSATRALALCEPVLRDEPGLQDARTCAYNLFGNRGSAHLALHQNKEALADFERVLELADQQHRGFARILRAAAWCEDKQADRAADEADVIAKESLTSDDRYNLACLYARTAHGPKADRRAAKAVDFLRGLRDEGYFRESGHAKLLRDDDDLKPLRGRADFHALVAPP